MPSICLYFQVHQPDRIQNYNFLDVNSGKDYFNEKENEAICQKVAQKCYLPMNRILLDLIQQFKGQFKVSFSITGNALDQFEKYSPETIESFKRLVQTGCVELLSETYYHSLAFLYSKEEFKEQVELHRLKLKTLFDYEPQVFRNTELIFNNELAQLVESMGYQGVVTEGADQVLGWRSPNYVYRPKGSRQIKLLLKNYKLSDDIAFRFSNQGWDCYPLMSETYANWISSLSGTADVVNLFMDYETFGEHHWEDTGIFKFFQALPEQLLAQSDNQFLTLSEAVQIHSPVSELDIPNPISWADQERDLSAWLSNQMQQNAVAQCYRLEKYVKASEDQSVLQDWRKLTTSDHFYYMCTKHFQDGDVHRYFSPFSTPYEAFINYMNVLEDIRNRVRPEEISLFRAKQLQKTNERQVA